MRVLIIVAGLAISLSACGSNDSATDDMNADANILMGDNMTMDSNLMVNDLGGMDANVATNADTEANLMGNDLNTNDPDTNIANGV